MAEANIGQNLSLKEALWTSVQNKTWLSLRKQAQLTIFVTPKACLLGAHENQAYKGFLDLYPPQSPEEI